MRSFRSCRPVAIDRGGEDPLTLNEGERDDSPASGVDSCESDEPSDDSGVRGESAVAFE